MKIKNVLITFFFGLISYFSIAQQTIDERMNNTLRENGKLNVVIAVLITIFAAILIFLISQEIKIGRLEKKINSNKNS